MNDPSECCCKSGLDVKTLRALADGASATCNGHDWTRDDGLVWTNPDGNDVTLGGWIVDGVTPIYDPQVPYI